MKASELKRLNKRVDEILATLEICDEQWDSDVIENLENELDEIETSLKSVSDGLRRCP